MKQLELASIEATKAKNNNKVTHFSFEILVHNTVPKRAFKELQNDTKLISIAYTKGYYHFQDISTVII